MADPTPLPDPKEGTTPSEHQSPLGPGAVEFMSLGLSIAVVLVAGGGLGYAVDRWVGTSPLFLLVGLALGIVAAVLMTVARIRKYL
jgi:F0F1-type ATP synthase assembly protein I